MPQARLPDINTSFIVYRRESISSWKSKTYDSAIGSLYAYNALLYPNYGVKVSTQEYNKLTKLDMIAECSKCQDQTNLKTLKIIGLLNTLIIGVITEDKYQKIWVCSKCNNQNKLMETKIVQKVLQEPHYLKIVPEPPSRRDGLNDRRTFHMKFSVWFWSTLTELEAEAARFRQEYVPKDQEGLDADLDSVGSEEDG